MQDTIAIEVNLPLVGKAKINFFDIAYKVVKLYQKVDEFGRQKEIKHLGLISKVFEGVTHTRYEYLMLQCALADMADVVSRGNPNAQGSIKINGNEYSGNALLKSWFLLSNFGHCQNTIGDEKALMLHALREPTFKRALLCKIKDSEAHKLASSIIANFDYTSFHHIISLIRIYNELPRRLELQNELVNIYKLLLQTESEITSKTNLYKLQTLKRVFSTLRYISIIAIDGHYSHSAFHLNLTPILLSLGNGENVFNEKYIHQQLLPFVSHLYDELYLDRKVQAFQRSYEILALNDLSTSKASASQAVESALYDGIVDDYRCVCGHFVRFRVKKKMLESLNYYPELRRLQAIKEYTKTAEASLDFNPIDDCVCIDFYCASIDDSRFDLQKTLYFICTAIRRFTRQLYRNIEKEHAYIFKKSSKGLARLSVAKDDLSRFVEALKLEVFRRNWPEVLNQILPLYRSLLWSIISFFFKENYIIDVLGTNYNYKIYGMKYASYDLGYLLENIDEAIKAESHDEDRVRELLQMRKSVNRTFDGYILGCLARLQIYDITKPPEKRKVTDIDSVVVKISKDSTIVEFHETKNKKKKAESSAIKDLRTMLVPALNSNSVGYRIRRVKGYGGKLVITHKN